MKARYFLAFLAVAVSCAGGSDTGNPATLKGFSASECKTTELTPGQQALAVASDADGLQCVEWSTQGDGALLLRLLNFPEPCGKSYAGAAALGDGKLSVSVYKDTCEVYRCGSCLFDFEFQLQGVDIERDWPLRIGSAVCETQPTDYGEELTLPLKKQENGRFCRYVPRSAVEQYGRSHASCGERNMPCGNCDGTDTASCAAGLACTEVAEGDARCLEACESDDDCTGGLTSCVDGLCQADTGW